MGKWPTNDLSSLKPMLKCLKYSVQRTQVGTEIEAGREKVVLVLPSCGSLELQYQPSR